MAAITARTFNPNNAKLACVSSERHRLRALSPLKIFPALAVHNLMAKLMRMHLLNSIFVLLVSSISALSAPPIALTWQPRGKSDALLINGSEFRGSPYDLQQTVAMLERAFPKLASQPIRVTIPDIPNRQWSRSPKFFGASHQIFFALTSPDREVTYFYQGRQLRRYRIRCSSKGTIEDWDHANYWLDGESLGNWEQARNRFVTMQWEKDAVADILFDRSNFLTSSSGGLYLHPDLKGIFNKHGITTYERSHYRATNDR